MNHKIHLRVFAAALFVLAVALRLTPHDYNVSAIGALGLFLGCFWSAPVGFATALAAMLLSDLLGELWNVPSMGFYASWMMLTVYLSMAFSAVIGKNVVGMRDTAGKLVMPFWASVPLGAVLTTVVFFLTTNFACWLDPEMGYPRTLSGLTACYVAAIPFTKNDLLGNLLFSVLFFAAYLKLAMPRVSEADAH